MTREMAIKANVADIMAAHLAGKLKEGEVRGGFSRALWPVDPPKKPTVRRRGAKVYGKRKRQVRQYDVTAILVDREGFLYGDSSVYKMRIAPGQPYRWATPEMRAAAGDRLQKAIVEQICPPEKNAQFGI